MLKEYKRGLFKKLCGGVENYAKNQKVWGSNIHTAYCLSTLIQRHRDLFDTQVYLKANDARVITSAFGNVEILYQWLEAVKSFYNYVVRHGTLNVPTELNWVVLTESREIKLKRFMTKEDGHAEDITIFINNVQTLLSDIFMLHDQLSSAIRSGLMVKHSNGYNTVLLMLELIIEVMINGQ